MTTIVEDTDTIRARQRALFARATDDVLFDAVAMLEAKHDAGKRLTAEENVTRAWIIGELEARYPEADAAMDAWVDSDDDPKNYSRVLRAEVDRIKAAHAAAVEGSAPTPEAPERRDLTAEMRAQLDAARRLSAQINATAQRYPGRVCIRGVGLAPAIPAGDLRVGDVLLLNGAGTETITAIEPKGKATVVYRTGPAEWQARTARRTSLVAIAGRAGNPA